LCLPIRLYHLHLGWLLGEHVMLTYIGHTCGQLRRTVLEVAGYDLASDTYTIVAGSSERSNRVRNIQHRPRVLVDVGADGSRQRSGACQRRKAGSATSRAPAV
jgi:hypothetical protein